jgi:hydrogenase nickel incorporation protein HypA/HybF
MHELSIAENIVEICEQNAIANNATKIHSVTLNVGELSGVVMEALRTAMDSAVKNTIMQQSEIIYKVIHGVAKCEECGNEFQTNEIYSNCTNCNSYMTTIIKGKEMTVASMDIE